MPPDSAAYVDCNLMSLTVVARHLHCANCFYVLYLAAFFLTASKLTYHIHIFFVERTVYQPFSYVTMEFLVNYSILLGI